MEYTRMSPAQQSSTLYRLVTPLLEKAGYGRQKAKNTGGAQITNLVKDGRVTRAVYKTSRNRWFSLLPDGDGGWKPLDGTDALVLVTVDEPDAPTTYQLYIFSADDVRRHLDAAKAAWMAAGAQIGGFGVWVSLDVSDKAHHAAGSGLAEKRAPDVTLPINEMVAPKSDHGREEQPSVTMGQAGGAVSAPAATIAEVLNAARMQIAALAGVTTDSVKLDLHIGG
jgi:hypothetical protein